MSQKIKHILLFAIGIICCLCFQTKAQELNASVTVRAEKIKNIDPSVFKQMKTSIETFLNSRQWTSTHYKTSELIDCKFLIDLQEEQNHIYKALLTIQSSRPVYNSSYQSPLLNYKDKNFVFKFEPYTPLVFNKNRITGNDPLVSNLTATLAYYAYIIIGLDEDSFSLNGGHDAFQSAQQIVNDAPNGRQISGWKSFDGTMNRYWLTENLLNVRYKDIHQILYNYHLKGMDLMYEAADKGRKTILKSLNKLNALNAANPNLMFIKVFFATKAEELAHIFSQGPTQRRLTALNLLNRMDPSHSTLYRKSIKQ